ncbi:uncharacterized protein RAG0_15419 [Rhynchosporium agropyri]|uniref:MUC1 Extracellular alpha-1,4-glucan glucosidase n=1 Tax=Rhynchosporium agropyri TaxID=914238 RepID=A0A1E1LL23_9HELO|nr:uncharacterized protein RAG0_15419 [Rhynchosporium agropyri]
MHFNPLLLTTLLTLSTLAARVTDDQPFARDDHSPEDLLPIVKGTGTSMIIKDGKSEGTKDIGTVNAANLQVPLKRKRGCKPVPAVQASKPLTGGVLGGIPGGRSGAGSSRGSGGKPKGGTNGGSKGMVNPSGPKINGISKVKSSPKSGPGLGSRPGSGRKVKFPKPASPPKGHGKREIGLRDVLPLLERLVSSQSHKDSASNSGSGDSKKNGTENADPSKPKEPKELKVPKASKEPQEPKEPKKPKEPKASKPKEDGRGIGHSDPDGSKKNTTSTSKQPKAPEPTKPATLSDSRHSTDHTSPSQNTPKKNPAKTTSSGGGDEMRAGAVPTDAPTIPIPKGGKGFPLIPTQKASRKATSTTSGNLEERYMPMTFKVKVRARDGGRD